MTHPLISYIPHALFYVAQGYYLTCINSHWGWVWAQPEILAPWDEFLEVQYYHDTDNYEEDDDWDWPDCGLMPNGICTKSGTEECEFECPYWEDEE